MTDDTTQDPLAALQDAIKKKQPGDTSTTAESATDPAVEEAKQRRELTDLETRQQQADQAALKTQLENLHQLTEEATTKAPSAESAQEISPPTADDQSGREIRQLTHTKVQGNS